MPTHPAPRSGSRPPTALQVLAASLLTAACSAPGTEAPQGGARALRGAAIELPVGPELERIADLELARDPGDGELEGFLAQGAPAVRARAAEALGRMPFPEEGEPVTAALCRALGDPDPEVRAAAALALGTRGDPAGAGCLANRWNDSAPAVRAAVARAAGHLDRPELRTTVLRGFRDPDETVRLEAVQASALWDPGAGDARDVDRALVDLLAGGATDEVRWRALYALGRRRAAQGRGAFLTFASSPRSLERLFSVRGLGRIGPAPGDLDVLLEALDDGDWRVACEAAAALGAWGDPQALAGLALAVDHPSPHVRQRATEALGELGLDGRDVRRTLWRALRDISIGVRNAARVSLARVLPPEEGRGVVDDALEVPDPLLRVGAARAAAVLPTEDAVPRLAALAADEDVRVAGAALEELGRHPGAGARAVLLRALRSEDAGLVLAAAGALEGQVEASDAPLLSATLARLAGEVSAETALVLVRRLGEVGGPEARRALAEATAHPDRYVRRVARQLLGPVVRGEAARPAPTPPEPARAPRPGEDFPRWDRNPLVEVRTTRGTLFFELFPAEAPLHVHNFLELAGRGFYEGLGFHRVVPDFVVQGGDPRGDGNGGSSWRGGPLPHEFGTRKFRRGSLGMPRTEDPDSGGSQFFVTHRPTPHLDGRYTIFGELRAGGEVLDEIEIGDRILGVRLLP